MAKYIFTNILGSFVFDKERVIDRIEFKSVEDYNNKAEVEKNLIKKHSATAPQGDTLNSILAHFKDKAYAERFYYRNIELTAESLRNSVSKDNFIIQAISNIEDTDKVANILVTRLREWYELYFPEFSRSMESHEKFIELILSKTKEELLKEINLKEKSIGADISKKDLQPMMDLAESAQQLYGLKKKHTLYLDVMMETYCKNVRDLCGALIAAKLIEHAKSLKSLAIMPSSAIQLLGAEKALFRHLKTRAKAPKHGLLLNHPLVANAKPKLRGKAARHLANKIAIAAKVDYNKGSYIADKLKKKLENELR